MIKDIPNPAFPSDLTAGVKARTVKRHSFYTRYFFAAMAFIFIVMAVVGFGEDYQVIYAQHIRLYWFVHVHGALLTMWLLFFFAQTILAAKGNIKLHRRLGQFSVSLGVLVWISMGVVTFNAHIGYPPHADISWANVLFLFLTMNLYLFFFAWGIREKRNAAAHKRLFFLATLVLIAAGFNRTLIYAGVDGTLRFLPGIATKSLSGAPSPSAFLLYNDLLLLPLFIYDLLTVRRVHKITLISAACIVMVHAFLIMVWGMLT